MNPNVRTTLRKQVELTKQTIEQCKIQIERTAGMISALAMVNNSIRDLISCRYGEEDRTPQQKAEVGILDGVVELIGVWVERLESEKEVLCLQIDYNQNLVTMAETGLILPR